jgi:putative endonuclease
VSTKEVGALGEKIAVAHLKKSGYKILEKNFVTHFGEIDIIANDNKIIVFVEVKLRRTAEFGPPAEAVDKRKQAKIIRAALGYVKLKNMRENILRFDVLAIGPEPDKIELIKDAFGASSRYTI